MPRRPPRIFIEEGRCSHDKPVKLTRREEHYLAKVLRLGPGGEVMVLNGKGSGWLGRLCFIGGSAFLEPVRRIETHRSGPAEVLLMFGLTKGNGPETVIRAGTEIGVSRFIPTLTERSVPKPAGGNRQWSKLERWKKIAFEASRQCGRSVPPPVDPPQPLADAVACPVVQAAKTRLYFSLAGRASKLHDLVEMLEPPLVAAVGPEGGFTQKEEDLFESAGFVPVGFGPYTLRAVTAGIAASCLVLYELDRLMRANSSLD